MGRAARGRSPQISAPLASSSYTTMVETQVCGMMLREDSDVRERGLRNGQCRRHPPKYIQKKEGSCSRLVSMWMGMSQGLARPLVQPIPWTHTDCRSKWPHGMGDQGVHTGCQVVSYQLYPMPRGARDSPRTLLLAGVLVRPVGAGDSATGRCHLVFTAGCRI